MVQDEFDQIIEAFVAYESMRSKIYYRALNLVDAGFVVEAHILLLATWNFARFRYVTMNFDLVTYETLLQEISQDIRLLSDKSFETVDFTKYRTTIIDVFNKLAAIRGIEYTGASKILHLLNRRVFVMWDSAIAGWHSPKKDYAKLDVVRSGAWAPPNYPFGHSGAGYYDFLKYCKQRFQGLCSPNPNKTFAKCIDEFNFCTITKRLPKAEKKKKR
jgi:hypothetical protein